MKLLFDPDFDGRAWPGPLAGREAICGESWVGPNMLVGVLETVLGLGGRWESEAGRAAALVPAVTGTAGFWSASAKADPLGTARTLLHWRDELCMAGWQGQPVAPRLKELAAVVAGVLPGRPDRLLAILEALAQRGTGGVIKRIDLPAPEKGLPLLWRRLLAALKDEGCEVAASPLKEVKAKGDLAAARKGEFAPKGDGSIELLRTAGPLAAAETVAAYLASLDGLDQVVVVTPEPVLDAALRRYGLPTTGASSGQDNALLQIVPLVLAMAWNPPDPQRALELLTLPTGPVPQGIARKLVEALQEWPAVDSDSWRKSLKAGIEECEPDSKSRVRESLGVLLSSTVKRGKPFPVSELGKRLAAIEKWAQDRMKSERDQAPWDAVVAQCSELRKLGDLSMLEALAEPQLSWLLDEATSSISATPPHPWQAGLGAVDSPGGLAGTTRKVVWWNFTRDSVPGLLSLPLSVAEKDALKKVGVDLVPPGLEAISRSERWHRPMRMTSESLLLVCPLQDEAGDESFPHPLWDEVEARIDTKKAGASLVVSEPSLLKARKAPRKLLELPQVRTSWQIRGPELQPREHESPSSLGVLIGCPFKYVVEYLAKLRGGETAALPEGSQLWGNLAHEIIERVLKSAGDHSEKAAPAAAELFEQEGPRLAASLFMPGAESQRAMVKQAITKSARILAAFLKEAHLEVVHSEKNLERKALGIRIEGFADLVLGPQTAVVDLKWSSGSHRVKELKSGTAYQLATYAYLASKGHQPNIPVAYFIIDSQRLFTLEKAALRGAEPIKGAEPAETWNALKAAYEREVKMLAQGTVRAPNPSDGGAEDEPSRIDEDSGALVLSPPCRFCDLGLVCGTLGR